MQKHMTRSSSIVGGRLYPKPHPVYVLFPVSGHGGQIPDEDGDETDGFDEGVW